MFILYWLEKIRNPFLDKFFGAITYLGDEVVFMALMMILFWVIDKKKGYYAMFTAFVGTIVSQFLKNICCIPRPFVRDPNLTIVESAREGASDYSFPSGHTQNAATSFGSVYRFVNKKWAKILCCIAIGLVGFSRLYLGVHTLWDVLVGLAIGIIAVLLFWPLFRDMDKNKKRTNVIFVIAAVLAIAYTLFIELRPVPNGETASFFLNGKKNAYTMLGATLGVVLSYIVDSKYTKFNVEAPMLGQILKCVLGFAIILAIKTVLKAPLYALTGGHEAASAIRYFIIVVFAGVVWPMTFKFWARIGNKRK